MGLTSKFLRELSQFLHFCPASRYNHLDGIIGTSSFSGKTLEIKTRVLRCQLSPLHWLTAVVYNCSLEFSLTWISDLIPQSCATFNLWPWNTSCATDHQSLGLCLRDTSLRDVNFCTWKYKSKGCSAIMFNKHFIIFKEFAWKWHSKMKHQFILAIKGL